MRASRLPGQVLERARGGDEDAFRGLIEPYRPALHAHCFRMLGSLHDADDALQNTLLRAWRALPKFRGKSSLRNWLYRIATNVCLDVIAGRRLRVVAVDFGAAAAPGETRQEFVAQRVQPCPDEALDGVDGDAAPEARYERREALELAFVAALQHLPPSQRTVLILRDVFGFSAREAAASLETTVAAVNGALLRARRAVNERLPERSEQPSLGTIRDRQLQEVVGRLADALERGEIDSVLALLAEDAPSALVMSDRNRPSCGSRVRAPGRGVRGAALAI
jgi:RNA polymerase sigma-70 factor, ECF subfamily